jgi:hypothetical protein
MANPFEAADAAAQAASEVCFGETFEVLARLPSGDYSGRQADMSRPVRSVAGILSMASSEKPLSGAVLGHDPTGPASIAGVPTSLWLSAAAATLLGYAIRKGDAVRCTGRSGTPVYTVSRVYKSDMGDITLDLAGEQQ